MMKKIVLSLAVLATLANAEMIQTESGIAIDTDTKLIWQDNNEATTDKNWQDAMEYCSNLKLGDSGGWKLPDFDTLQALYPKKDSLQIFSSAYFWSSTTYADDTNFAWVVGFNDNNFVFPQHKTHSSHVRCVRAGQNFDTLNFSSFIESLKTSNSTQKSVVLTTSRDSKSKLFLVNKDGKNYFGTIEELAYQIGEKHDIFDYVLKSCELGRAETCLHIAKKYSEDGDEQDFFKAAEFYQKVCESNDKSSKNIEISKAESCYELATLYTNDVALEVDYNKAIRYYSKGCDLNHFDSCVHLGYQYDTGEHIKQNFQKAYELYKKSCDGDNYWGCRNVGILYKNGEGVKQNYAKAIEYYEKTCNEQSVIGCNDLGRMYQEGLGVKKDFLKASEYYKKACQDAEDSYGCSNLGMMYQYGSGVKRNKKKALEYFNKSCDLGNNDGCNRYEELKNNM